MDCVLEYHLGYQKTVAVENGFFCGVVRKVFQRAGTWKRAKVVVRFWGVKEYNTPLGM